MRHHPRGRTARLRQRLGQLRQALKRPLIVDRLRQPNNSRSKAHCFACVSARSAWCSPHTPPCAAHVRALTVAFAASAAQGSVADTADS
jgi:hypothetical protein